MKCGWLGGIAAVALAVLVTSGGEGAVVVNGRVVFLSPAARTEGGVIWVPVLAFCPLIGIDSVDRYGTVSLRWNGGRDELRPQESREIAGVTFAPVDDLVSRVGGTVRREAGDTSIEVPVARLVELSAGVDGLTVRLDGFAPTSVLDSAGVYVVRLSNCRADPVEMSVTFGPAGMGRATIVAAEGLACEIRVTFLEVAALAVNARDSGDDYPRPHWTPGSRASKRESRWAKPRQTWRAFEWTRGETGSTSTRSFRLGDPGVHRSTRCRRRPEPRPRSRLEPVRRSASS